MSGAEIIALDTDKIWAWLEEISDPEIPVVSIVDLGIVRNVHQNGSDIIVDITPTYSGCPATSVIALDIETALLAKGVKNVKINRVLSPPWTTDWITKAGRKKLQAYGIAPPHSAMTCPGVIKQSSQSSIRCPHCDSLNTKEISRFGSTPCKASYQCLQCREPFDYFKAF